MTRTPPKAWAAMTPVRSYGRSDEDGNLFRVEVRMDPVTGAKVQVTTPMPSQITQTRGAHRHG